MHSRYSGALFISFVSAGWCDLLSYVQMRTGAHVQIQKDSEQEPGATERKIYVSGSPSVIEAARNGGPVLWCVSPLFALRRCASCSHQQHHSGSHEGVGVTKDASRSADWASWGTGVC
jgi:hypothetical protein